MVNSHGRFAWYELLPTDVEAAKAFYTGVMGWGAWDASVPGRPYTLFTAGNVSVGGLMNLPQDAWKTGVSAELDRICRGRRRGRDRRADQAPGRSRPCPADGRCQHQPLFDLLRPASRKARAVQVAATRPDSRRPNRTHRAASAGTSCSPPTGRRRWLSTARFLAGRRPTPTSARRARISCSPSEGRRSAAWSPSPRRCRPPSGCTISTSSDIDAAAQRVKAGGGQILGGALEVPGGSWIVQCTDPQGAMFALEGQRGRNPVGYFERVGSRAPSGGRGPRWSW